MSLKILYLPYCTRPSPLDSEVCLDCFFDGQLISSSRETALLSRRRVINWVLPWLMMHLRLAIHKREGLETETGKEKRNYGHTTSHRIRLLVICFVPRGSHPLLLSSLSLCFPHYSCPFLAPTSGTHLLTHLLKDRASHSTLRPHPMASLHHVHFAHMYNRLYWRIITW